MVANNVMVMVLLVLQGSLTEDNLRSLGMMGLFVSLQFSRAAANLAADVASPLPLVNLANVASQVVMLGETAAVLFAG